MDLASLRDKGCQWTSTLRRSWEMHFLKKRWCCWGPAWWYLGSAWSRVTCLPRIWKQASYFCLACWANVLLAFPLCFCVLGRNLGWGALASAVLVWAGEARNLGAATLVVVEHWITVMQSCGELDVSWMQSSAAKRRTGQREHNQLRQPALTLDRPSARHSLASLGQSAVLRQG